jgi:hypothetical protein
VWSHSTWWRGGRACGKEHVAEVRRGRTLTWTKTSAQHKSRNLQHTDYYVFFLVFDQRGHFLRKYTIELDMIFTNNTIINMILLHIYMTIIP